MAVVYWIHLDEHTDVFTQGYVGVCKTTAKFRATTHRNRAANGSPYTVHKAMRKYADEIRVTTLVEADHDYCYAVEGRLRPAQWIGWNMAEGGRKFPKVENPRYHTGPRHTPASRKLLSEACKQRYVNPWDHPTAHREMWLLAQDVYSVLLETPKNWCRSACRFTASAVSRDGPLHKGQN